jgi:glutamate carboxypeptidase
VTSPAVPAGAAPPPAALLADANDAFDRYLEDLRMLVNIECGTYLAAGVNRVADLMEERFRSAGWRTERIPHRPAGGEPQLGDVLVATLDGAPRAAVGESAGAERNGRRIVLVGHMDTVFPDGTAAERPFRMDRDRAFGPGVSDMKGGLLAGLNAVGLLQRAGFDGFGSITYICNPDEEIGSPFSGPLIKQVAEGAGACFVLEGARENGDIVSARKGVADVRIVYHGRAAHAGVEPWRGRSAVLQAAHAIVALHQLNDRWEGVTVNAGVVRGGTRPNVVAERCEVEVDLRATSRAAFDEAFGELRRVALQSHIAEVLAEFLPQSGFPPMEKTPGTARLADLAKEIAAELGFELRDASTGGASDANPIAGMGVPVLDGLGPIGGDDHSASEWVDLASVPPRTALLASLIARA